jgi:hypothetical protein
MKIEIGDLVQIEIGGALCLPKPQKITEITDYQEETYVFVETSSSGVPLDNVILIKKWYD